MKHHFIFLIFLVAYNFSFAQSKKEEIQILNQRIDSLKFVHAIEKDFYDDEGNVWEAGSYDIKSKSYRMIRKEH